MSERAVSGREARPGRCFMTASTRRTERIFKTRHLAIGLKANPGALATKDVDRSADQVLAFRHVLQRGYLYA